LLLLLLLHPAAVCQVVMDWQMRPSQQLDEEDILQQQQLQQQQAQTG
jgi:hypothetical protein